MISRAFDAAGSRDASKAASYVRGLDRPRCQPPNVDARELLQHLHDRRAILLVEPGGARHVVDLLAHVRQQERRAELLSERRLELLVLETGRRTCTRRSRARASPSRAESRLVREAAKIRAIGRTQDRPIDAMPSICENS